MKLDTKQKVLIAIYTEYQKDIPNMKENIKSNILKLDKQVFMIALDKLYNENLITGVTLLNGGGESFSVITENIKMTPYGIDYVESKLGIDKTLSGLEKVKYISEKTASWGWEQFKDISSSTLAKMLQNSIGAQ